jgi:hypothetical protein
MWMMFLPRMALRQQAAIAVACLAPPAQAARLNPAFQQALAQIQQSLFASQP